MYGSYPYAAASSICLSAVHCGVLDEATGGSVFVSRFYRHDWSNGSAQSIFPFASAASSRSNGVSSENVPTSAYSVPSNGTSWSYVVRGRGEFVQQRRSAPFSPRSGHAHVSFPDTSAMTVALDSDLPPLQSVHVVVGGFDGAAYLNDAWVAEPAVWLDADSDSAWRRLPDAPFSSRADMQTALVAGTQYASQYGITNTYFVYFLGGQTGHSCGLYELGECSDEVWALQLNVSSDTVYSLQRYVVQSYEWTSTQPLAYFPFAARCGAALLYTAQSVFPATILVGGQLSYNDTTCAAPPVAVSEVWVSLADRYTAVFNYSNWQRDTDAPFSPRRSQQRDDAFVLPVQPAPTEVDTPFIRDGYPLVGGMRVLNLSSDGSGVTTLGAVQVWTEVWLCSPFFPVPGQFDALNCSWSRYPSTQPSATDSVPLSSVPLPLALGSSLTVRSGVFPKFRLQLAAQRFGGFTPRAAVEEWTRATASEFAPPQGAFNWTFMRRAFPDSDTPPSVLALQRLELPLYYVMGAHELGNMSLAYGSGSEWIQASSAWQTSAPSDAGLLTVTSLSTVHPQRASLAASPADATPYLPQPASSSSTQRSLFRFDLPRLSASYDEWSNAIYGRSTRALLYTATQSIVAGGRSAGVAYNDWIAMSEVRCLPPDDPSWRSLLGPLRLRQRVAAAQQGVDSSYAVRDIVTVGCALQYHFEPRAARRTVVQFQCGPNGVWLDTALPTVRKCVANAPLNCTAPLINAGEPYCQPPEPTVTTLQADLIVADSNSLLPRLAANTSRSSSGSGSGNSVVLNSATLVDFPITGDTPMQVFGSFFTAPLTVLVGGLPCADAQLAGNITRLCYNVSCSDESGGPAGVYRSVCDAFGDALTCSVPAVLGLHLPVEVTVGPAAISAARNDSADDTDLADSLAASISSTPPVILAMFGYGFIDVGHPEPPVLLCNSTTDVRLYDCPADAPFNLSVCLLDASVGTLPLDVTLGADTYNPLVCVEQNRSVTVDLFGGRRCLRCLVQPFVGTHAVRVQHRDLALQSRTDASISSSACSPGYRTNFDKLLNHSAAGALCEACPAGSSTMGALHSIACVDCDIGHFAPHAGSPNCSRCAPGTYANETGSTRCRLCPLNHYQPYSQMATCIRCEPGTFVRYTDGSNASMPANAECAPCPTGAACNSSGVVSAVAGAFLVIDQAGADVVALPCMASACVTAHSSLVDAQHALTIDRSALQVVNQCARGRYPAFDSAWQAEDVLQGTDGVNVLCAHCLPGHTQVNGHCIPCASVHWGRLLALLLACLLAVYALHRMPHDWSGGAKLTITAYFLQQCGLFVNYRQLSLVNLDVLGLQTQGRLDYEQVQEWCIVPLESDVQRLSGALLTVPVIISLLLPLALLHGLLRHFVARYVHRAADYPTWFALYSLVCFAKVEPERAARPSGSAFAWGEPMAELRQPLNQQHPPSAVPAAASPAAASAEEQHQLNRAAVEASVRGRRRHEPRCPTSISDAVRRLQASIRTKGARAAVCAPPVWLLYQRSVIRMLQLSYTALALLSIRFFNFVDARQYGVRLVDYPSINFSSTLFIFLVPLVGLVLLLVCGLPVLLFLFLFRRDRGGQVTALLRVGSPRAAAAATAAEVSSEASADALTLQLCCMFRPNCWWMAAFIPLRRLLLVAVYVLARGPTQWVWLTAVNQLLLVLHLVVQPYRRPLDNCLESLNLAALTMLTTLLCLGRDSALPGVVESLAVGPLCALVAVSVVLPVWRTFNRRKYARSPSPPSSSSSFASSLMGLLEDRDPAQLAAVAPQPAAAAAVVHSSR